MGEDLENNWETLVSYDIDGVDRSPEMRNVLSDAEEALVVIGSALLRRAHRTREEIEIGSALTAGLAFVSSLDRPDLASSPHLTRFWQDLRTPPEETTGAVEA